ncbi:hypothetical protein ABPG77_006593 [Micractinium sp. CCAP 211/92]
MAGRGLATLCSALCSKPGFILLPPLPQDKPLLYAARRGDYTTVVTLLRCGADTEAKTAGLGLRPLHVAAAGGRVGVVQALVQSRAKLEARDSCGARPLHYAAQCGSVNVIRTLLAAGARVDCTSASGDTPAHWATRYGMAAAAVALVQAGAPMEARNKEGKTPLDVAAPEVRWAMLCVHP